MRIEIQLAPSQGHIVAEAENVRALGQFLYLRKDPTGRYEFIYSDNPELNISASQYDALDDNAPTDNPFRVPVDMEHLERRARVSLITLFEYLGESGIRIEALDTPQILEASKRCECELCGSEERELIAGKCPLCWERESENIHYCKSV